MLAVSWNDVCLNHCCVAAETVAGLAAAVETVSGAAAVAAVVAAALAAAAAVAAVAAVAVFVLLPVLQQQPRTEWSCGASFHQLQRIH